MKRRIRWTICGVAWLTLAAAAGAWGADSATITFQRVFKGSSPEFILIKVSEDGTAAFDIRQLSEDSSLQPFEVGSPVRAKILQLAQELHNFQGADLDIHKRIADLGEKTFRYEKGGEVHETKFNYTIDRTANQLLMIFDGLSQQQQDLQNLEQKLKYDRLGVNDALRQFESDLGKRTLPEPERLLPILDRVATDTKVVEVARQRARSLAERIRSSQVAPQTP